MHIYSFLSLIYLFNLFLPLSSLFFLSFPFLPAHPIPLNCIPNIPFTFPFWIFSFVCNDKHQSNTEIFVFRQRKTIFGHFVIVTSSTIVEYHTHFHFHSIQSLAQKSTPQLLNSSYQNSIYFLRLISNPLSFISIPPIIQGKNGNRTQWRFAFHDRESLSRRFALRCLEVL